MKQTNSSSEDTNTFKRSNNMSQNLNKSAPDKKEVSFVAHKILLVLSPWLLSYVLVLISNNNDEKFAVGLTGLLYSFFGIPFIGIFGLIWSFVFRNSKNANRESLNGYLIAAIIVWLLMFVSFLAVL